MKDNPFTPTIEWEQKITAWKQKIRQETYAITTTTEPPVDRTPQAQADYEALFKMLSHLQQMTLLSKRISSWSNTMSQVDIRLSLLRMDLLAALLEVEK